MLKRKLKTRRNLGLIRSQIPLNMLLNRQLASFGLKNLKHQYTAKVYGGLSCVALIEQQHTSVSSLARKGEGRTETVKNPQTQRWGETSYLNMGITCPQVSTTNIWYVK